eukprot:2571233-Amphidinium_carterae.2
MEFDGQPDPMGILSRPYELTDGYVYPHLAEGIVVYQREEGRYPRSCVPRFVDVDAEDETSLKLRMWQERQALLQLTPLPNPDRYPLDEGEEVQGYTLRMLFWHGAVSKQTKKINANCYKETHPEGVRRTSCYACRKGHPDIRPRTWPRLSRCLICKNVYMCQDHRIFLACLGYGSTATICCRHSRFTPGISSWNPEGGYPVLQDASPMSTLELWEESDPCLSDEIGIAGA